MSASHSRHADGLGAIALAALLAATLLAGCGGGGSSGATAQVGASTSGSGAGSTNTASTSSTGASKVSSNAQPARGHAKAAKATAPNSAAPNSTARVLPPVGGRVLREFAGSGNARLGTIVVSSPEVLVWSAQHPSIQIFTANEFILVSSRASSGSIQLSRGTYPGMRVATHAGWSIQLRTRS